MLARPPWIELTEQEKRSIHFVWDDTRALKDFTGDAAPVLRAAMKMSLRARMVLCMGLYEWIVWRFEGLHQRPEPLQIAQVGWCATVDPRYMRFFELSREEWLGPIDGPLWCTATWLHYGMRQAHLFPKNLYESLSFLSRMVLHVIPVPGRFQAWQKTTLERLDQVYPLMGDDPFKDLFDRNLSQRLGPLIGRNVLDPTKEPDANESVSLLTETLREARETNNPFLSPPGELEEAGFVGTPYVIPI